MAEIILDVAPNTFKNDLDYFEEMVNAIRKIDTEKYDIIFKTQMFGSNSEAAKVNLRLANSILKEMNTICEECGYKFTSSVFDYYSLVCLLGAGFPVPFVKFACRPELYYLSNFIPHGVPIYMSIDTRKYQSVNSLNQEIEILVKRRKMILLDHEIDSDKFLLCVPEYPCKESDYQFNLFNRSISDHTEGLKLFDRWENDNAFVDELTRNQSKCCFEMHYILDRDQSNPDAGPFAKTISELSLIL